MIDSHKALPQNRHGRPDPGTIQRGHGRLGHGQEQITWWTRLGGDAGDETNEEKKRTQTAHEAALCQGRRSVREHPVHPARRLASGVETTVGCRGRTPAAGQGVRAQRSGQHSPPLFDPMRTAPRRGPPPGHTRRHAPSHRTPLNAQAGGCTLKRRAARAPDRARSAASSRFSVEPSTTRNACPLSPQGWGAVRGRGQGPHWRLAVWSGRRQPRQDEPVAARKGVRVDVAVARTSRRRRVQLGPDDDQVEQAVSVHIQRGGVEIYAQPPRTQVSVEPRARERSPGGPPVAGENPGRSLPRRGRLRCQATLKLPPPCRVGVTVPPCRGGSRRRSDPPGSTPPGPACRRAAGRAWTSRSTGVAQAGARGRALGFAHRRHAVTR